MNPLLADTDLPNFAAIRPEHVGPAVDAAIAQHAEAMTACATGSTFADVFLRKEAADTALARVWQAVSHLHMVADTPELRAAHGEAQPRIAAHGAAVGQDAGLFHAIQAIPRDDLSAAEQRALALTLQDFELSGVALPPAERSRFAEIAVELGRLSTDFSNAVLDATEAWTLHLTDPARLAGVPDADRAMLAAQAQAKGLEGWLIDLHAASVRGITAHADDRELRREVLHAFNTRASDTGPDAGAFDNSERMAAILRLRQEASALLGFADPVARSLATKMAGDAAEVIAFLEDLARRARPGAEAELADLRTHGRTLGIDTLEAWDVAYVAERLRKARHDLDETAIKRHLPLPRVLDGLFGLIGDLYGAEVRESAGAETWHQDVRYYTLHRKGQAFAGIYCDFFARSGKRGGAWMDVCRPRLRGADGHLPIAFLTCNFAQPVGEEPAYLSHTDMVTLFHEMGHCLHHVLTEVDLPSVGGIAGVEWDAVELPSQFTENFAWEPAMLKRVSAQAETGEPLDDPTIARMLGARRFLGAMALLRQVEFSLFDIRLHLAAADPAGASIADVLAEVRRDVAVLRPPEWNRFAHAFSHIFAGGYAAGYYSYLWAERLSADAFEAFAEADVDRAALGACFRDHVLAQGGARPALENFRDFRGREPSNDALLRSFGLAA